ncbi:hypothetical protein [Streptomyces sp. NPDC012888]|uniref:hypothetical protein n=1 Tax=Streptomyces sp. NPDC012888 TaxID=3364855 RepID=UPI0036848BD1
MADKTVDAAKARAARQKKEERPSAEDTPILRGRAALFARRLSKKTPVWASRREMGPWEQKEGLLARIAELEPILGAAERRALRDPDRRDVATQYAAQARSELDIAKAVLEHHSHALMRRASHLGVAQSHVDSALNLMIWLCSADDIKALLPQMLRLIDDQFATGDPQRIRATEIAHALREKNSTISTSDRAFLAGTVSLARRLIRKETLRVRSFVRIVLVVAWALLVAAAALAVLTFRWSDEVPLCFTPENMREYHIICPTGSTTPVPPTEPPTTAEVRSATQRADYLVVQIGGVLAASVAAAATLRRIRGTSLPYNVPVALAFLKLPMGALTAPLGLLLMRGGFIPGLSALDSSAQIIAWAIVFGYSQQLFTRFVDAQGQALLNAVHGHQAAAQQAAHP